MIFYTISLFVYNLFIMRCIYPSSLITRCGSKCLPHTMFCSLHIMKCKKYKYVDYLSYNNITLLYGLEETLSEFECVLEIGEKLKCLSRSTKDEVLLYTSDEYVFTSVISLKKRLSINKYLQLGVELYGDTFKKCLDVNKLSLPVYKYYNKLPYNVQVNILKYLPTKTMLMIYAAVPHMRLMIYKNCLHKVQIKDFFYLLFLSNFGINQRMPYWYDQIEDCKKYEEKLKKKDKTVV